MIITDSEEKIIVVFGFDLFFAFPFICVAFWSLLSLSVYSYKYRYMQVYTYVYTFVYLPIYHLSILHNVVFGYMRFLNQRRAD